MELYKMDEMIGLMIGTQKVHSRKGCCRVAFGLWSLQTFWIFDLSMAFPAFQNEAKQDDSTKIKMSLAFYRQSQKVGKVKNVNKNEQLSLLRNAGILKERLREPHRQICCVVRKQHRPDES